MLLIQLIQMLHIYAPPPPSYRIKANYVLG
jgi:hypothetical protein